MSEAEAPDRTTYPSATYGSEPFLRGLVGSAVLLLLADVAEPFVFGAGYYASLSVHPYWIIILLAAVQNGLYVGVATAGLATLMVDWPARPVGVDISAHYVDVAILPLQWLIAALIIGMFRQNQLREEAGLRHENARLTQMNDQIANEVLRLDAALARAELEAATRPAAPDDHHARHAITSLSRLADVSRQLLSDVSEGVPHYPLMLLIENARGGFDVWGDGIAPWIADDSIAPDHPVAVAVRGLAGQTVVRADDACFICRSLPQYGLRSMHGAVVAVLPDDARADEVQEWLRLLAPLVSVALNPEDDGGTPLLKSLPNPDLTDKMAR